MTDRPIIFSAPMVRALLDGRKSQTRRIFKVPAGSYIEQGRVWAMTDGCAYGDTALPYAPGDRLYVREAFAKVGDIEDDIHACPDLRIHAYYRADAVDPERQRWRPSIHMPRWASRLTLTVTEVRVQRLQEISEEDAVAEGIQPHGHAFTGYGKDSDLWMTARNSFQSLWNSLHGSDAWDANPWVCAVSFTVERRNIDMVPA